MGWFEVVYFEWKKQGQQGNDLAGNISERAHKYKQNIFITRGIQLHCYNLLTPVDFTITNQFASHYSKC